RPAGRGPAGFPASREPARRRAPRARACTCAQQSTTARGREPRQRAAAETLPLSAAGADVEDVAVVHHVVLPLQAKLAGLSRAMLAARRDEVVVVHHLGAHEAALQVGVDAPRRPRRAIAAADGPGPHLVFT